MVHQTVKLVDFPVQLPSAPHLLSRPLSGVQYCLLPKVKLIACSLSGKPWRTEAFVKTVDIIMSRWREGTKCYHSYIKKWINIVIRVKIPFVPLQTN